MKKNSEELLTYEILKIADIIHLAIPVQNLINPSFKVINNDFYINIDNNSRNYLIKNLPDYLIEFIKNDKVFLKENLSLEFGNLHPVKI